LGFVIASFTTTILVVLLLLEVGGVGAGIVLVAPFWGERATTFSNDNSFYFCSCNLDVEYFITVRMSHTFQELNYFVYTPTWGAHCIKI
jgi:hypothetical protein